MAVYGMKDGVSFGFCGIEDWLNSVILSFPAPWTVGDRKGKYYGTEIVDARGKVIMSVWLSFGNPSQREKGDMTDEQWAEYCCDSHWESETSFHLASSIVATRNHASGSKWPDERAIRLLRTLIVDNAEWDELIYKEISCGGPERRKLEDEL